MAKKMYVQVRKENIRATPSFLGTIVSAVHYGDIVVIRKSEASWHLIEINQQRGWLHASAISTNEIELIHTSSQGKLVASDDELALAGKGFNKEIEDEYRQRNRHISFADVDAMETVVIDPMEMQSFIKQGHLLPQEDRP